jgi:hypothetical protein
LETADLVSVMFMIDDIKSQSARGMNLVSRSNMMRNYFIIRIGNDLGYRVLLRSQLLTDCNNIELLGVGV